MFSKKQNTLIIFSLFFINFSTTLAFSDLPESHKYFFPLTFLQTENIIEGYSDGSVKPDNQINRAELIKILVTGLIKDASLYQDKNNCFPDVTDAWYANYVCYAKEKNWIAGYPDGNFKPDQPVNKAESLKIILNAFEIQSSTATDSPFLDTTIDQWFFPYLKTATEKNLLEEFGQKNFYPEKFRTRGEIAELVSRIMMINYMPDPKYTPQLRAEFQTLLLLNKLRSENGVQSKLILNRSLTKVAREHSLDMAENIKDMSHVSSDGVTQSYDRIKSIIKLEDDPNFTGRTGENVGRGSFGGSTSIYDAIKRVHYNVFMVEPDGQCNHRTTILSTCLPFSEVGIGVYTKDSLTYFTEDFISR